MFHENRTRTAGILGMLGAGLFFIGLLIEYRYGLFPPGSGTFYVLNQIQFFVAMTGILAMLWGMRAAKAGGSGRLARIALTLFPIGWAMLILGGIVALINGSDENLFIPLGALTILIFGLLTGIVVASDKRWQGWTRYAPLLQALYYLLVMMMLPLLLTGSNEPTLLTESLWMATWFLMGLALVVNGKMAVVVGAAL